MSHSSFAGSLLSYNLSSGKGVEGVTHIEVDSQNISSWQEQSFLNFHMQTHMSEIRQVRTVADILASFADFTPYMVSGHVTQDAVSFPGARTVPVQRIPSDWHLNMQLCLSRELRKEHVWISNFINSHQKLRAESKVISCLCQMSYD